MWMLGVRRDGVTTADVHLTPERVQTILATWSKQPVEIIFFIHPCACEGCKPVAGKGTEE